MGLDHINVCETGLALGLGFKPEVTPARAADIDTYPSSRLKAMSFEASLTLGLVSDENKDKVCIISYSKKQSSSSGDQLLYRQDSGASSFSNNVSVKREREQMESGDTETPPPPWVLRSRVISDRELDDDDGDGSSIGRKKLRLSKAQSALLEESFKQHTTLNPKQKQELARELNLRPRQVEVWFQNRRARRKLKQTEVDCEYWKKWCESLRDENRRLEQEVEALKVAQPLYMQLPAGTVTMCPSCERVGRPVAGDIIINSSNTPPFTSSNSHFYNSFPNNPSSAPCN